MVTFPHPALHFTSFTEQCIWIPFYMSTHKAILCLFMTPAYSMQQVIQIFHLEDIV